MIPYYEQVINDIEEQERIALATTTEGWYRSTNTTPVPDVDFKSKDPQGENTQDTDCSPGTYSTRYTFTGVLSTRHWQ